MLSYRINDPFVEITLTPRYELGELRALFKSVRDDPNVPKRPLLLFDSSARTEALSPEDALIRLGTLIEILGARAATAFAVVVSPTIAGAARIAQQAASGAGRQMGIFDDIESARRWLGVYANTTGQP